MVEYIDGTSWLGLCNIGFKPEYAKLICQELGHASGSLLPAAAYGKYYKHIGRPNITCTGEESSILDCAYDSQIKCFSSHYHYVSISCHADLPDKGKFVLPTYI